MFVCVNLQACLNAGVAELNKEKTEEQTFKPQTEKTLTVILVWFGFCSWSIGWFILHFRMNCLEEKQQPFACLFNWWKWSMKSSSLCQRGWSAVFYYCSVVAWYSETLISTCCLWLLFFYLCIYHRYFSAFPIFVFEKGQADLCELAMSLYL